MAKRGLKPLMEVKQNVSGSIKSVSGFYRLRIVIRKFNRFNFNIESFIIIYDGNFFRSSNCVGKSLNTLLRSKAAHINIGNKNPGKHFVYIGKVIYCKDYYGGRKKYDKKSRPFFEPNFYFFASLFLSQHLFDCMITLKL